MTTTTKKRIKAHAWIGHGTSDEYWADGIAADVEVERTDEDEIRIGVQLEPGSSDDVTLYLTDGQAARLAFVLGAEILT